MEKHLVKVNELLGKMDDGLQRPKERIKQLTDQIRSTHGKAADLQQQLHEAIMSDGENTAAINRELNATKAELQEAESLLQEVQRAGVRHAVTADELLAVFREAEVDFQPEFQQAIQQAKTAKAAYHEALTQVEKMAHNQRYAASNLIQVITHRIRPIGDVLPKSSVPSELYVSLEQRRERGQ